VASQRYRGADDEVANPFAEQEAWESEQMKRTKMKVCSKIFFSLDGLAHKSKT